MDGGTAVLADACPVCDPGCAPASLPVGTPETVPGGIITAHECSVCGSAWETFWHDGWAVDRRVAPVSPSLAGHHRDEAGQMTRRDAA